jgi:hypothetical protein
MAAVVAVVAAVAEAAVEAAEAKVKVGMVARPIKPSTQRTPSAFCRSRCA